MTEQPLDLRRVLHAFRRRWKALFGLFVVGLGIGAATLLQPPTYVSRALVLLPPSALDPKGEPLRSMETEAHIATSPEILERAARTFNPPIEIDELDGRVHAREVSSDILEVRAEAGRAHDARMLADAIADEYVAYTNGATAGHAGSTIALLQAQADELQQRIRQLESSIAAGVARLAGLDPRSPEALRQGALVDSMRLEQVDASRQLSGVNGRIADARLNADLSGRGTRVLERAEAPAHATWPRPEWSIGGGAVIGLIAGGVLALALDRNDGRLRRRDDIAEAVGAPVVATLAVPRRGVFARSRALLDRWQPDVVESLVLRQAFERLGVAEERPPVNLLLVVLPGDRAGPAVALELAAFAATLDTPTALVIASAHPTTADLRSASISRRNRPVRPGLTVHDLSFQPSETEPDTALRIVVVVADSGHVIVPAWCQNPTTVLAVSSGFPTPEGLAAAALAAADAGYPIRGVLVANAEPGDPTTGHMELAVSLHRDVVDERAVVHDFRQQHRRADSPEGEPHDPPMDRAAP